MPRRPLLQQDGMPSSRLLQPGPDASEQALTYVSASDSAQHVAQREAHSGRQVEMPADAPLQNAAGEADQGALAQAPSLHRAAMLGMDGPGTGGVEDTAEQPRLQLPQPMLRSAGPATMISHTTVQRTPAPTPEDVSSCQQPAGGSPQEMPVHPQLPELNPHMSPRQMPYPHGAAPRTEVGSSLLDPAAGMPAAAHNHNVQCWASSQSCGQPIGDLGPAATCRPPAGPKPSPVVLDPQASLMYHPQADSMLRAAGSTDWRGHLQNPTPVQPIRPSLAKQTPANAPRQHLGQDAGKCIWADDVAQGSHRDHDQLELQAAGGYPADRLTAEGMLSPGSDPHQPGEQCDDLNPSVSARLSCNAHRTQQVAWGYLPADEPGWPPIIGPAQPSPAECPSGSQALLSQQPSTAVQLTGVQDDASRAPCLVVPPSGATANRMVRLHRGVVADADIEAGDAMSSLAVPHPNSSMHLAQQLSRLEMAEFDRPTALAAPEAAGRAAEVRRQAAAAAVEVPRHVRQYAALQTVSQNIPSEAGEQPCSPCLRLASEPM